MDDAMIVHVRFAPDGTVTEIGERPATLSAQEWFNVLSERLSAGYKTLAGGRAIFRTTRAQLDACRPGMAA